jgi:hypothetical protein
MTEEQEELPTSDFLPLGSYTGSSSWLNVEAPEFIPTLSHDCPIIGICEAIPEDCAVKLTLDNVTEASTASAGPRSPRSCPASSICSGDSVYVETPTSSSCSLVFSTSQDSEFATPTKEYSSDPFHALATTLHSSKKTSAARKKRRAAAAAAKRARSQERREDSKGDEVDGLLELPEMSEEDWERRRATRQRALYFGKITPEYARYCQARSLGEEEESGMKTPDPEDRSISKRRWKYIVQQWREALKQLYGSSTDGCDTGSTVSADEGLSIITGTTDEADVSFITGITDEADVNSTSYGDDFSIM